MVAELVEASKEPLFSFHIKHPSRSTLQVAVFQSTRVNEKLTILVCPRQGFWATQQCYFHIIGWLVEAQHQLVFRVFQGDGIKRILALRVADVGLLAGLGGF